MAKHLQIGKQGEDLAVDFFCSKGYRIIERNWRYRHWEIDLVFSKNQILHFVEVKTKSSDKYGFPEEAVTRSKFRYLLSAAEEYLFQHSHWKRIQFDVLSIVLQPSPTYFLLEDVYMQ
jgi:putative endonuclease